MILAEAEEDLIAEAHGAMNPPICRLEARDRRRLPPDPVAGPLPLRRPAACGIAAASAMRAALSPGALWALGRPSAP